VRLNADRDLATEIFYSYLSADPQDQPLRIEEEAARGQQGDPCAGHLAAARMAAQLGDRLTQVSRSL
jgi:hypothetical protein